MTVVCLCQLIDIVAFDNVFINLIFTLDYNLLSKHVHFYCFWQLLVGRICQSRMTQEAAIGKWDYPTIHSI